MSLNRRELLKNLGLGAAGVTVAAAVPSLLTAAVPVKAVAADAVITINGQRFKGSVPHSDVAALFKKVYGNISEITWDIVG